MTHPNNVFESWNQTTINAFYKYCTDKCVLVKVSETLEALELIGPINNILESKEKWYFLSQMAREKTLRSSIIERPNSTSGRTTQFHSDNNISPNTVYKIMISYCQADIRKCQRLINRLTEEGFSIWAKPASEEYQRDVTFQMNKSDCIILCISEDYYENVSCKNEAQYAFQMKKQVFLVKIQNHPLIGWQRDLFEEKLFFQLFGSENHFDLECGKLLLEIVGHCPSSFYCSFSVRLTIAKIFQIGP